MITKIALIQMSCAADKADNLDKASGLIAKAAGSGAGIICLPELFFSPYFPQYLDTGFFELAEGILLADVNLDLVRRWHTHQQFFRDRRPDTYKQILEG